MDVSAEVGDVKKAVFVLVQRSDLLLGHLKRKTKSKVFLPRLIVMEELKMSGQMSENFLHDIYKQAG